MSIGRLALPPDPDTAVVESGCSSSGTIKGSKQTLQHPFDAPSEVLPPRISPEFSSATRRSNSSGRTIGSPANNSSARSGSGGRSYIPDVAGSASSIAKGLKDKKVCPNSSYESTQTQFAILE